MKCCSWCKNWVREEEAEWIIEKGEEKFKCLECGGFK
jgi:hypothetical protein